ncbi:MAG TPA: ComF family protein [Candidatus Kapabacteria bacterium]|nr:ComF family protein [Candidatus Kapabacteria bacterium]
MCKDAISDQVSIPSKYICYKCFINLELAPTYQHLLNEIIVFVGKEQVFIDKAFALYSKNNHYNLFDAIYSLKYYGKRGIGNELGILLWKKIRMESDMQYDYLLPVPIHSARKRERGYNQSEHICKGLSRASGIPYQFSILKRIKYTKSQTRLHLEERKTNVENIFKALDKGSVLGKNILVVDDVLTTGSTLNSIAKLLKSTGANTVDVATLIKA